MAGVTQVKDWLERASECPSLQAAKQGHRLELLIIWELDPLAGYEGPVQEKEYERERAS